MQQNKAAMAVTDPDWQTKRSTIASRMNYIFNTELLSDVKFVVPAPNDIEAKKVIPAHKFVLAISSPVFFTMFYGQMVENTDTIELPDCDYDSLLEFFRFLYTDDVCIRKDFVFTLMYLAKKYMVPALGKRCSSYLQSGFFLQPSNVFSVLPVAQRFEDKELEEKCWKVIEKHTLDALKSKDFCAVERSVVESVVKRDVLRITEVELFKAINYWATMQSKRQTGKSKREIVGDEIVKAMRFPSMSQKEFVSVVAERGILTTQEIVAMMKHYSDIVPTSPFPFSLTPRSTFRYEICRRFKGYLPPKPPPEKRVCANYHLDLKVSEPIELYGIQHFGSENGTYTVSVEVKSPTNKFLVKQTGTYVSVKDDVHEYYCFSVLFERPVRFEGDFYYALDSKIEGPNPWLGIREDPAFEFSGLTFDCSIRDGASAGQHPGFFFDQEVYIF